MWVENSSYSIPTTWHTFFFFVFRVRPSEHYECPRCLVHYDNNYYAIITVSSFEYNGVWLIVAISDDDTQQRWRYNIVVTVIVIIIDNNVWYGFNTESHGFDRGKSKTIAVKHTTTYLRIRADNTEIRT